MSRHFYDLIKMMNADIDKKALSDPELYSTLITHRKHYSMLKWMSDYKTLERDKINFIVPDELRGVYEEDYKSMQAEMIYETAPPFGEVMKKIKMLYSDFTGKVPPLTIVKVQPEFPSYKFYKNIDTAKLDTWKIPVDEYNILRLQNITLSPIKAKYQLGLKLRVQSEMDDYTLEFDIPKLYVNPAHKDHLFFIDENKNPIDIILPPGRKWVTISLIIEDNIPDFEMALACEWIK